MHSKIPFLLDKSPSSPPRKIQRKENFNHSPTPCSSRSICEDQSSTKDSSPPKKRKKFTFNKSSNNVSPKDVKMQKKFSFSANSSTDSGKEKFFNESPRTLGDEAKICPLCGMNFGQDNEKFLDHKLNALTCTFNKSANDFSPKQEKPKKKKLNLSADSSIDSFNDIQFVNESQNTVDVEDQICPICEKNFGQDNDKLIEHAATCSFDKSSNNFSPKEEKLKKKFKFSAGSSKDLSKDLSVNETSNTMDDEDLNWSLNQSTNIASPNGIYNRLPPIICYLLYIVLSLCSILMFWDVTFNKSLYAF